MANPIKTRKRILLGLGIAVALLLVVPFLLPLGHFIPEIERIASEKLKAPVKVQSLRLSLLPLPHLTLDGIAVGKSKSLEIGKIVVTPRLSSLFSNPKVISVVSLHGVVIGHGVIAKAADWAAESGNGAPAAVRVERIEVRDAFVNLTELKQRAIDLDLELTPEGGISRVQAHADDGHLNITLLPRGKDFSVEISAHDWRLLAGPPLLMSSLTASGILDPQQGLTLASIEGRLYGGTVSGKLNVGWAKQWSVKGNLDIQGVEIQPVVALYTKATTISGRLTANPVVDMHAPSAAKLGEAVDVESDFRIEQGILYNVDLGNAPTAMVNKAALKGGQTQFDHFSGHLGVDSAGYYLTKVDITSGGLTADAEVFISSKQELSGQIDVAIKGTSAIVSTPLALSGTVQNPSLHPSGAALAGAAAGTALLGPGLGTAVGMKAARFTQKLFGGRPAKKVIPAKTDTKSPAATAPSADNGKQPPAIHTGR